MSREEGEPRSDGCVSLSLEWVELATRGLANWSGPGEPRDCIM